MRDGTPAAVTNLTMNAPMHRTSLALAALITVFAAGCAATDTQDSTGDEADELKVDPLAMPAPIVSFLKSNDWGAHHLEWHTVRNWDRLGADDQAYAKSQGWARASLQEGVKGNGLEFLAMHRVMFRILTSQFPESADLFAGWSSPPTDPSDELDRVPAKNTQEFDAKKLDAIDKLQNHIEDFKSDDELGLFLETSLRPTKADPNKRTTNKRAGIHNYLHNRFSGDSKRVDIGDPSVNLQNKRFWRLHGWIESRWTEFRKIKGLGEADPKYAAALKKGEDMLTMRPRGTNGPGTKAPAPASLRGFFVNNND